MAAWRWRWHRARAPSAWRAGAIPSPSSCRVTACWPAAARKAASRAGAACRPSGNCWRSKAWSSPRPEPEGRSGGAFPPRLRPYHCRQDPSAPLRSGRDDGGTLRRPEGPATENAMRVLITRPEREAAALAAALGERGHMPVIAPLFRLEILHPPPGFAAALAACQAVLLTSANGARALAEASDQRGRPILAVGDTTATTAEGLGFSAVTSASGDGEALVDLVRRRLDAKAGPLLHVSGVDVSFDLGEALGRDGFEVQRFALYDAREAAALPDSARAALQARALDVATFFSPRAAALFARLLGEAGLAESVRGVTALAISPAALEPLADLPFTAAVAAARPTRQAVLDEIDRLASAGVTGVKGQATMSDAPASSQPPTDAHPVDAHLIDAQPVKVRRGLGVFGAFITGLVAAVIVLAAALISLPYWPQEARALWPGQAALPPAPTPGADLASVRAVATTIANATVDAAKRELNGRLDDLEKRLRALSATAAERPAAADPAIGELRSKVEALENRPAAQPPAATSAGDADKEV